MYCSKLHMFIYSFNSYDNLVKYSCYLNLIDEETKRKVNKV